MTDDPHRYRDVATPRIRRGPHIQKNHFNQINLYLLLKTYFLLCWNRFPDPAQREKELASKTSDDY